MRTLQARKRYELVLFPCERHSPHKLQDKVYIEDIMHDFFVTNLHPSVVLTSGGSSKGGVSGYVGGAVSGVSGGVHKVMDALSSRL